MDFIGPAEKPGGLKITTRLKNGTMVAGAVFGPLVTAEYLTGMVDPTVLTAEGIAAALVALYGSSRTAANDNNR